MTRDLMKLPAIALLALAAACGGGDEQAASTDTVAQGTETAAAPAPATDATAPAPAPAPATGSGTVHDVKMVTTQNGASGEFQPATITVKRGDRIRWTMADGTAPHNVSFSLAQGNPAGFTPPTDSPLYTQAGQNFEVPADWAPGTYNYVCMPHAGMGMRGTITVTE